MNNLQPTIFFNTSLAAFKSFEKAHPIFVRVMGVVASIAVPIFVFLLLKPPPPPIPVSDDKEVEQPRLKKLEAFTYYTMETLKNKLQNDEDPNEIFLSALETKMHGGKGVKDEEVMELIRDVLNEEIEKATRIATIYFNFETIRCPVDPLNLYARQAIDYHRLWYATLAYDYLDVKPGKHLEVIRSVLKNGLKGERNINQTRTIVWILASELEEGSLQGIIEEMEKISGQHKVPERSSTDTPLDWLQRILNRREDEDLIRLRQAIQALPE